MSRSIGPAGTLGDDRAKGAARWSVTPSNLVIGPSSVRWDGEGADHRHRRGAIPRLFVPWQRQVRGTSSGLPRGAEPAAAFALDGKESHIWHCLCAPARGSSVEMQSPGISWSGKAYLDHNRGAEPLETGFNNLALVARASQAGRAGVL